MAGKPLRRRLAMRCFRAADGDYSAPALLPALRTLAI
jgi:hypothetical protein